MVHKGGVIYLKIFSPDPPKMRLKDTLRRMGSHKEQEDGGSARKKRNILTR